MPIKNEFFGVNKTLMVGGKFVIAESATRSRSMKVNQKNFIQGTAANRIMDIGGVSEDISISAPILIGGGSYIDGRTLLNTQIQNALLRSGAILPILESAEITISEEAGMVELKLKSDGNPANTSTFSVTEHGAHDLADSSGHSDVLNPLSMTFKPTRTAKFYDFRVALAGYIYFVKSARISVEVEIEEFYFIGAADGSTSDGTPIPSSDSTAGGGISPLPAAGIFTGNPYNIGTQFPWLGVSGIKINGGGTAAVLLQDTNADYNFSASGEAVNVSFTGTELTLQQPGDTVTVSQSFALDVYDAVSGTWIGLFNVPGTSTPLVDLSKAIIDKADFKVEAGLMTVDFGFKCYVKDAN
jgi:hypothetical protein